MISRNSVLRRSTLSLLFVFGTAFSIFVGSDQRNFLVILFSALSLPLIAALRRKISGEVFLIVGAILPQVFVTIFYGDLGGLTTVFYAAMLSMGYAAAVEGLRSEAVGFEAVVTFLKTIIFLYAAVSLAQLLASLLGLPIPNEMLSKGEWSYNSLAVEPSHAARALSITMLAYLVLVRKGRERRGLQALINEHRPVLAAFLFGVGLTGSATGIIAGSLAIVLALPRVWGLTLLGVSFFAWPLFYVLDVLAIQRSVAFISALPTMDVVSLVMADHSGALRVIPSLVFIEKADPMSMEFWFGGGLGAITSYLRGELIGAGDSVGAGFIPGYIMAFGVVGTAIFLWVFLIRFSKPVTRSIVLLWIVLFSTSAWNSQLFWYGLMLVRVIYEFKVVREGSGAEAASRSGVLPPSIVSGLGASS